MSLAILDTTILSNFAHAQRPELVQAVLAESAATTAAVVAELRQGEALGFVPRVDWRWLSVLDLTADEEMLLQSIWQFWMRARRVGVTVFFPEIFAFSKISSLSTRLNLTYNLLVRLYNM